ncbi:hypothetical protein PV10_03263 [Exophiala mesophila]|uniref:RBR-type E3 ubiquitin transferase n=1 Tax=Exophiala mesophila TaxID=212818 RepID=A0A0D1ZNU1_EXOME|nr:uncharacterized protein PV10_03263 [Exophiala mesophila]KIV95634.1 hypothetical protein PV10_03263 [Exophiala mesophila]
MRNHHRRVRFSEQSPRSAARSAQETSSPSEGISRNSAHSHSQQSEPSDILSTTANDGDAESSMWMYHLQDDPMELESNNHSMTTYYDMFYDVPAPSFNPLTMARHTMPRPPPLSSVPSSIPTATSTNPSQLPLPMPELTRMSYTRENPHRITRGYNFTPYYSFDPSHPPLPPDFPYLAKTKPHQSDGNAKRCQACHDPLPAPIYLTCGHPYCRVCLNELVKVGTANRASWPPRCCFGRSMGIDVEHIQDHLDRQVLLRYISVTNEFCDRNPTYCDNASCSEYLDPERLVASSKFLECPRCNNKMCSLCKQNSASHTGINNDECRPPEALMSPGDLRLAKSKKWKQCPGCRVLVERTEGCAHMICTCGVEFCYDCGEQSDSYDPSCACTRAASQLVEARRNNHRTVLERVRDVLPSSARRRRGDWDVPRPPHAIPLWRDEDWPTVNPIGTGHRPQMSLQPTQNPESIQRPVQPYNTIGSTPNPDISSASAFQPGLDRHLPNTNYDNMNDTWMRNTNLQGPRFHRRGLPLYESANAAAAQNIHMKTAAERNNQHCQPPTLPYPRVFYPPGPPSLATPRYNPYVLAPLNLMDPESNTYQQSVDRHASSSSNHRTRNNDPAPAGDRQRHSDEMRGWHWRYPYFAPRSGGERTGDGPPGTPVEAADVDTEIEDTPSLSPSSTLPTDLRSRL